MELRTAASSWKTIWVFALCVFIVCAQANENKLKQPKPRDRKIGKDVRDMDDVDLEHLLDQWEQDEEPLEPDELPEHLRPQQNIDLSKKKKSRTRRSGEEGCYPDLTRCAEDRLGQLKPRSRLLYDPKPVMSRSMLGPDERKQLDCELDSWTREMRTREYDLEEERGSANETQRPPLPRPAIRRSPHEAKLGADRDEAANAKEKRRLASCDYAAWDRYDAETEVSKIDLRAERELAEAKRLQEKRKHELARNRKEVAIEKCEPRD
ncbi:unnamed protein product [Trichogramma brassicae]|uniref:Uncharacterized protein n=1 Tax=Trichogramma brassicae TaxID=86971 RepID=A0A6H5IHP5_9HYME|nr:unnamed protein product [Trichogramma brassicae]